MMAWAKNCSKSNGQSGSSHPNAPGMVKDSESRYQTRSSGHLEEHY